MIAIAPPDIRRCLLVSAWLCLMSTAGLYAVDETPSNEPIPNLSATMLEWDGSPMDGQQAQDWLSASGNATLITGGKHKPREIAFSQGTYWQAVIAVCDAFNLRPQAPQRHLRTTNNQPQSGSSLLPVGLGSLTLAPQEEIAASAERWQELDQQQAIGLLPTGPLLLEIVDGGSLDSGSRQQTLVGVYYRVRVEPRVSAENIGSIVAQWQPLTFIDGSPFTWPAEQAGQLRQAQGPFRRMSTHEQRRQPPLARIIAESDIPEISFFSARGELDLTTVRERSITITLKDDESKKFRLNGEAWEARFVLETPHQARSAIEVSIPGDTESAGNIQLTIHDAAGKELRSSSRRMGGGGSGGYVSTYYIDQLDEQGEGPYPLTLALKGHFTSDQVSLPFAFSANLEEGRIEAQEP